MSQHVSFLPLKQHRREVGKLRSCVTERNSPSRFGKTTLLSYREERRFFVQLHNARLKREELKRACYEAKRGGARTKNEKGSLVKRRGNDSAYVHETEPPFAFPHTGGNGADDSIGDGRKALASFTKKKAIKNIKGC